MPFDVVHGNLVLYTFLPSSVNAIMRCLWYAYTTDPLVGSKLRSVYQGSRSYDGLTCFATSRCKRPL